MEEVGCAGFAREFRSVTIGSAGDHWTARKREWWGRARLRAGECFAQFCLFWSRRNLAPLIFYLAHFLPPCVALYFTKRLSFLTRDFPRVWDYQWSCGYFVQNCEGSSCYILFRCSGPFMLLYVETSEKGRKKLFVVTSVSPQFWLILDVLRSWKIKNFPGIAI